MSVDDKLAPLDAAGFASLVPVSRETLARLTTYLELLERWQRAINLVGRSTMADPWRRHLLDSAQLARYLPPGPVRLADLGSGAGLPGLVLAIMGAEPVHLVEADRRKAQFLSEVVRTLGLAAVTVHAQRIETVMLEVDVVTSRALAPLPALLELATPLLGPSGKLVLLKGRSAEAEIAEARCHWTMRVSMAESLTDPSGRVLVLDEVRRRER
jgi:16S rRNA (guanine527-N7)-methyltransferase